MAQGRGVLREELYAKALVCSELQLERERERESSSSFYFFSCSHPSLAGVPVGHHGVVHDVGHVPDGVGDLERKKKSTEVVIARPMTCHTKCNLLT